MPPGEIQFCQIGAPTYSSFARNVGRSETVDAFSKVLQHVPRDLLKWVESLHYKSAHGRLTLAVKSLDIFFSTPRRAFLKMCNSPEAFLSLRSHFISSHALLCVSQWILGIGDRHLSNFMINMETGGMIGIDFGHAFGSATQVGRACFFEGEGRENIVF